ncbi:MAG: hypothetical protein LM580_04630 [Thermofilum sp.]|jgi:hypothetical protein|nr:hypothetical protein [Thermofilum sp.]
MEQKAVKWSSWRKWRWRLKAARRWGLRGLLLPIDVKKDTRSVSFTLKALFASVHAPLTLTEKLPYVHKLHALALDIVLPRLWGYDFVPPEVTIDEVIAAAAELLDYIEKLKEKDEVAAEIVRDLAYSYTDTVYHAVDELANLENDNKLAYIAVALHYLKGAIIRGERRYVARAAEEAVNAGIAANPEKLKHL